METLRTIAHFLLSRSYNPDPQSTFEVALHGPFVRMARHAYLRSRQAVHQFLVLCPSRISRDVCKLICLPILRSWFDDCAWFESETISDLQVRLVYETRKHNLAEFGYFAGYVHNSIVFCLQKAGSLFASESWNGDDYHESVGFRNDKNQHLLVDVMLINDKLDFSMDALEMTHGNQFAVSPDVETACGHVVDMAMIDQNIMTKTFLYVVRARPWRSHALPLPPKGWWRAKGKH